MGRSKGNLRIIPKFELKFHLLSAEGGHALYRDDGLGVQCEIHTPKKNGEWGKQVTSYFIDGDDREYFSQVDFMESLLKRKKTK
jgi:hypothetical protein